MCTGFMNVPCLTLVPSVPNNFMVFTDRMSSSFAYSSQCLILNTVYTCMLVIYRMDLLQNSAVADLSTWRPAIL
jgi:hypothetical protein